MDPRSMSIPMVRAPPNRRKRPILPSPRPDRKTPAWRARSTSLPGDVPERAHHSISPHRGLALDAGVGPEDDPGTDPSPSTYHRIGRDPRPRPDLRVAVHNRTRTQVTV